MQGRFYDFSGFNLIINGFGFIEMVSSPLRIASLAAAVLLGFFIYIIRRRAELIGDMPIPMIIRVLSWIITAFMAFNTLGNLASTSTGEKNLFGPIPLLLAVACLIVSASSLES